MGGRRETGDESFAFVNIASFMVLLLPAEVYLNEEEKETLLVVVRDANRFHLPRGGSGWLGGQKLAMLCGYGKAARLGSARRGWLL